MVVGGGFLGRGSTLLSHRCVGFEWRRKAVALEVDCNNKAGGQADALLAAGVHNR